MIDSSASFLNAEQAAQFLGGLHIRTVTRWAREGYLPAYPIGEGKRRIWRYLRHDLAEWMLGRRNTDLESCYTEASSGMYTRGSHRCSHPGVSK